MRIVTMKELKKMPDGTVFMLFDEGCLHDDIGVISRRGTEKNGDWLYGVEYVTPYIDWESSDISEDISDTEWLNCELTAYDRIVIDTASFEYDDGAMFAVFNANEISNMISVLQDALTKNKQ